MIVIQSPVSSRHHLSFSSSNPPPSPLSASSSLPLSASLPNASFLLHSLSSSSSTSAFPSASSFSSSFSTSCWSHLPADLLLQIFRSYLPSYSDFLSLSRSCSAFRVALNHQLAFDALCVAQRWPRLRRAEFVEKLRSVTFFASGSHIARAFSLSSPPSSSSLLPSCVTSGVSHLFLPSASQLLMVTSAPLCAFKVFDRAQQRIIDSFSPSVTFSAVDVDVAAEVALLAHANSSTLYRYSLGTQQLTPVNRRRGGAEGELVAHTSTVTCVKLLLTAADGRLLGVSGSYDATVRCWDLHCGEQVARLQTDGGTVWCVDLHPGGRLVCAGSNDKAIRVFSIGQQQRRRRRTDNAADGEADADEKAEAEAADTDPQSAPGGEDGGLLLCKLEGHTRSPMVTKFDPSDPDRCLFSAGYDAVVRQWDFSSGVQLRKFKGHTATVFSLCITAHVLISSSRDGTVRIHDRCSRVLLRVLTPRLPGAAASSSSSSSSSSAASLPSASIGDIKTVVINDSQDSILCGTTSGTVHEWRLRERGSNWTVSSSSSSGDWSDGGSGGGSAGSKRERLIEDSLSLLTESGFVNLVKSWKVRAKDKIQRKQR
jgi:hypothetical protein